MESYILLFAFFVIIVLISELIISYYKFKKEKFSQDLVNVFLYSSLIIFEVAVVIKYFWIGI